MTKRTIEVHTVVRETGEIKELVRCFKGDAKSIANTMYNTVDEDYSVIIND